MSDIVERLRKYLQNSLLPRWTGGGLILVDPDDLSKVLAEIERIERLEAEIERLEGEVERLERQN